MARIGGRELRCMVGGEPLSIGAADDCDFVLREPTISRRHARVYAEGEALAVEDLGSRNGVYVDQRRVVGTARVKVGQRLRLGEVEVLVVPADAADAELAVPGTVPGSSAGAAADATLATAPLARFCASSLPPLLRALADGVEPGSFAARVLAALVQTEPGIGAQLRRGEGMLAMAGHADATANSLTLVRADLTLVMRAPPECEPLLRQIGPVALDLIACAARDVTADAATPVATANALDMPGPASQSPVLVEIYRRAALVAPSRIHVLIEGETGTGKELMARYLHQASGLPEVRFVALNCAALPRDLLDAELFGIEAGVATGVAARAGKFEQAHGGTLFLDEIADMAPDTQARLLRVLQEGVVYRIGSKQARPAEVRVVSACNRDLAPMVAPGQFRLDLYHRIADWPLRLPPLRERAEDIGNLAACFLERECRARGVAFGGISRAAMEALMGYTWPGNVRELEREMARVALFLNDGEALDSSLLKPAIVASRREPTADSTLAAGLEREEKRLIEAALRACDGNAVEAAKRLGIGKSTLYRRVQQLGIQAAS
ncbi:MAG TPA: sigma 54-interacting transcriptional regulator [Xanthomonadaceae bacterium]|nr:sigma 54-interacting transcriptional regulator [Xanthomonadaceae bacterium]